MGRDAAAAPAQDDLTPEMQAITRMMGALQAMQQLRWPAALGGGGDLRRAPACTRSCSWHTGAHDPLAGLACGRPGRRGMRCRCHLMDLDGGQMSGPGRRAGPGSHLVDLVGRHFGQAGVQARERGGREARDHVVSDDHRRDVARAAGRQALGRACWRRERVRLAIQLPAQAARMS